MFEFDGVVELEEFWVDLSFDLPLPLWFALDAEPDEAFEELPEVFDDPLDLVLLDKEFVERGFDAAM